MVGSLQVRFILSNHRTGFRVPNMTKSRHSDLIDNHIFRSAEVGSGILLYPVLSHNHGHRQSKCQVSESSSSFKRPQRPPNDQEGNFTADGPRLASGESPDFWWARDFDDSEAILFTARCSAVEDMYGDRAATQTILSKGTLCTRLLLSTSQDSAYRIIFCLDITVSEYDMSGEALGLNSSSRCSARSF